jgi:hypothetical protein
MQLNLERAAEHFCVITGGIPTFGWRMRSIGSSAASGGDRYWLRVVSELSQWACGRAWTGNADANAIGGIAKPQLVGVTEWDEGSWRRQRAELLTLLPGSPAAPSADLTEPLALSPLWWRQLKASLQRLRTFPTERVSIASEAASRRLREAFGIQETQFRVETVHGDLHWQNVLTPRFALIDWELWGRGQVHTDVASLLLHSLRIPSVFDRVAEMFAAELGSEDGRLAQLVVGARLLSRIRGGDFPELAHPLRKHLARLGATPLG